MRVRSGYLWRRPAVPVLDTGPELLDASGWTILVPGTLSGGTVTSVVRKVPATNRRAFTFDNAGVNGGGNFNTLFYTLPAARIDLRRPYRVEWVFDQGIPNALGPEISVRFEVPTTATNLAGGYCVQLSTQVLGANAERLPRVQIFGSTTLASGTQRAYAHPIFAAEMAIDVTPDRQCRVYFQGRHECTGTLDPVVVADRGFGWIHQINSNTGGIDGSPVYRMRVLQ